MIAGITPIPKNGIINPSRAKDGMVCIVFTTGKMNFSRFLILVIMIPSGILISIAINKLRKDKTRCSFVIFNR